MRLDWNEVRARAAAFSERWRDAKRESADKHSFWNEFFACLGVDAKQAVNYEQRVANMPGNRRGFIDAFIPGKLIIEQKSAGLDLKKAGDQALDYFDWLPEAQRPRYILTCDFQRWHLHDLEENRHWHFTLPELKKHITAFAFIPGVEVRQFKNQKAVNPKATELLTKLHRQLEEDGYSGHALQLLLVRLLFMLFADDTGIWQKDQLLIDLQEKTQPDGSDLGNFLTVLFDTLNRPKDLRQASLPEHFKRYPYINGKLFEEPIRTAQFNNALRTILIDASLFDWGEVSPAIFGALFEGVIDKVTRRKQGAHYTPEDAIYRLIGPLFLEALHDEFERIKARSDNGRSAALRDFQDKLAGLRFLDPACGAGNFLVVTYRELRELERCVIEELYPPQSGARQGVLDVKLLTKVSVDQFCGIEIDEFPSQIAQVALWMTDHIANVNLGEMFGRVFPDMPIVAAPHIRHADALEIDWNDVLSASECDYVLGNPPFSGKKEQSRTQKAQVNRLFSGVSGSGELDYVSCWFKKAMDYSEINTAIEFAFVATNSVTQGEQVAPLWSTVLRKQRIRFAHRTFEWQSPSKGKAHVHCVIVGLTRTSVFTPILFDYPDLKGRPVQVPANRINPYLLDADDIFVRKATRPLTQRPTVRKGSEATDFGHLTLEPTERAELLLDPNCKESWIRPFWGGDEYINGMIRYCLWLVDANPAELRKCAGVNSRISAVAKARSESNKPRTVHWSKLPALFSENRQPENPYLLIPKVSSQRRDYVPMGFCNPDVIVSGSAQYIDSADLFTFGLLTSAIHMAWMRTVGGRTKSDYQYTNKLVYNTFPWPDTTAEQRSKIAALAQAVLDARNLPKNRTSTLADLYHPNSPAKELRDAHRALDAAVDRLYRPKGFADDRERVEHLFRLYEQLVHPTSGAAAANRRTKRRTSRAAAAS